MSNAPVLITAGQLIRGPVADRITDGAVLLRGGELVAAGPVDEVVRVAGPDAVRRSFPAATVMPGLVNGHVHLCFEPGPDPVRAVREDNDDELLAGMARAARTLLESGVTTARDLGDRGGLALRSRDDIAAGRLVGPRILAAGVPLTPPGGHCHFLGGEVDGHHAIRARIRASAAAGVDLIKVMASGGHLTPGGAASWEPQFAEHDLRVIVAEAARHGLRVAAHAHGTPSIIDAVAAGVATIEHCTWMSGPGTSDRRADVATAMAQQGIIASTATSGDWRKLAARLGEQRAQELLGRLRWMADLGVHVLPGTDAGLTPFDGLPSTLVNFQAIGFTAAAILDMATTGAAAAIGLEQVTGRLLPGMAADLIVVDGDPLTDLASLTRIELVVARGRSVRPRDR